MLEWLSPLGFASQKGGGCFRWRNSSYFYIAHTTASYGNHCHIDPFGQIGFDEEGKIFRYFFHEKKLLSPNRPVAMAVKYANFVKKWSSSFVYDEDDDLKEFLLQLRVFVTEQLLPLLESYDDPEKIVRLYLDRDENQQKSFDLPFWYGYDSAITGLILSRLFAREHYPALRRRYERLFDAQVSDPEENRRISELCSYLDQDTLPALDVIHTSAT